MSKPSALNVEVTREGLNDLLKESGALAATFPTTLPTGIKSVAYTMQDPDYGLSSVRRQFRQHLKRGAAHCEVRLLTWKELRQDGLEVNLDTARRRNQPNACYANPKQWGKFCEVVSDCQQLKAVGCLVDGTLASFIIAWVQGNRCEGLMTHHTRKFAEQRPSHAVMHGFTRTMIAHPEIDTVCIGRDMFPPKPSLARFKRYAGYSATPIQLGVVIHPSWNRLLTNPWSRAGFRSLRQAVGSRSNFLEDSQILDVAAATEI
ncbi:MAG: GNAT family N-acetyltransferase [Pirellulaceae bacterium]|nr:GNAT family N-acetyltransferase [Pirellulaceae bacterium]